MKRFLLYTISILVVNAAFSQTAGDEDKEMFNRAKQRDQQAIDEAINEWWTSSMKVKEQRIAWWREAKFGMFIHWGIYSLPGGEWKGKKVSGYAEHLMRKEKISRSEYLNLAHQFNPEKFNAEEWILQAKKAGMKYFIITAKHHDGFALYDSKFSDFDIVDQTPFKRDPMAELATAAKKHGMKFGFYYSHAFDWEYPDAPGNDWEYNNPGGDKLIGGANWYDAHPEWLPKAVKYVDEKAIPQIKELLQKYHPDILWFDTPHKLPLSENIRILKAIRETDPNVVVNGRLVRSSAANFGDYKNTADRPAEFYPVNGDWEAIPTTNESYGYHKYDSSHKSVGHFIRLIASAAARGGNLLMNIGPKGDGSFDVKDEQILTGIGKWMQINGESIYGTTEGPLPYHSWGVSTVKDSKLYLHVFHWPKDGKLYISGHTQLSNGHLLADVRTEIKTTRLPSGDWLLTLPKLPPDSNNTVLRFDYHPTTVKDSIHFITRNTMIERFLAFDADQLGKGFNFGDGKTDRYYLDGWKTNNQSVSWRFRKEDPSPGAYKVFIKYLAKRETNGGSFTFVTEQLTDNTNKELCRTQHGISTDAHNVIIQELGTIILRAGTFRLSILPATITKQELMKLLEIQLIPTTTKR